MESMVHIECCIIVYLCADDSLSHELDLLKGAEMIWVCRFFLKKKNTLFLFFTHTLYMTTLRRTTNRIHRIHTVC
jgi:hypothetical protein